MACECETFPQQSGPCEWPILECRDCPSLDDLLPDDPESPGESPSEAEIVREAILTAAIEYLWDWTGKIYGLCRTVVRPHVRDCELPTYSTPAAGLRWSAVYPTRQPLVPNAASTHVDYGGDLHVEGGATFSCPTCQNACGCNELSEVILDGPVHEVTCVLLDGKLIDPSHYRVDNRSRLVALNGLSWPTAQNLSLDCGPGTFEVHYLRGVPVPAAGQLAAGVLAMEMAKAYCGDDSCQLTGRVQTIDRQGIGFVLEPPDLSTGATGIWSVDNFVLSKTKAPRRSRVMNPDLYMRSRRPTQRPCVGCSPT